MKITCVYSINPTLSSRSRLEREDSVGLIEYTQVIFIHRSYQLQSMGVLGQLVGRIVGKLGQHRMMIYSTNEYVLLVIGRFYVINDNKKSNSYP
jgi:hypothetical protein